VKGLTWAQSAFDTTPRGNLCVDQTVGPVWDLERYVVMADGLDLSGSNSLLPLW
jgi:hypothetical protein